MLHAVRSASEKPSELRPAVERTLAAVGTSSICCATSSSSPRLDTSCLTATTACAGSPAARCSASWGPAAPGPPGREGAPRSAGPPDLGPGRGGPQATAPALLAALLNAPSNRLEISALFRSASKVSAGLPDLGTEATARRNRVCSLRRSGRETAAGSRLGFSDWRDSAAVSSVIHSLDARWQAWHCGHMEH